MIEEKRCKKCRKIKTVDYFYFRNDVGDYQSQCKYCLTGNPNPINFRTYFMKTTIIDYDKIPTLQELKQGYFLDIATKYEFKVRKICKVLSISTKSYYNYVDKIKSRSENL